MTTLSASFLRQRDYLAVGITHFFVDVLNGGRNLLVAILAISLGLTNAQVGIALLLYNVGNALSQPIFGWLADRIGPRWLVVGGMGWMMLFYGLAAVLAEWPALIALTVAGVGSGAFHPTGTMVASQVSGEARNRATAVFFMTGQLGLFIGPIAAGMILEGYGRSGYLVIPLLAFIAFLSGWQWVAPNKPERQRAEGRRQQADIHPSAVTPHSSAFILPATLLSLIILSYSTVSIAAMSFAPKLFTELGYTADYVGWLAGLFTLGTVVGGLTGGALADRINGKWVILMGMAGLILPVYFYIPAEGAARVLLLFLAGFFNGMPHTILVLRVQELLPGRRALASGLALGSMFFTWAVGSYVLGLIADQVGLGVALQGTAVLPIVAVLATLLLPPEKQAMVG
jgi:MFS transporter, FSR family, fosmidomycin resistance protein